MMCVERYEQDCPLLRSRTVCASFVIGHSQKGLHKVYDQHAYLDEKRRALDWWAARLGSLVEQAPDNIVQLPTPVRA